MYTAYPTIGEMIKVLDKNGLDELGIGDPQTDCHRYNQKSCRISSPNFDRVEVNSIFRINLIFRKEY